MSKETAIQNTNMEISDFNQGASFLSFPVNTMEEKKEAYRMASGNGKPFASMINKPFKLKHFYVEPCEYTQDETGEITKGARVVLMDDKGEIYSGGSIGIVNSLYRLVGIFGHPLQWEEPMELVITQVSSKNGNVLILETV